MTNNTTRTRTTGFLLTLDSGGRREARLLLSLAGHTRGVQLHPDGAKTAAIDGPSAAGRASDFLAGVLTIDAATTVGRRFRSQAPRHPDARDEIMPRWEAGELATLADLDRAIMAKTGVARCMARAIRTTWGIRGGARGAILTRGPS